jgi:hypothetical protein
MAYKKTVKGDNNQASEVGSFNRVFIDFNGAGMVILALFVVILVSIALIWMAVKNGRLLAFLVTSSFVCFFLGMGAIGGMFVLRYWSGTRRQLASDKAAQAWQQLVMYTDSHIISKDPQLRIENARDIQEVRHFNDRPVITEVAESLNTSSNDLPPASDLLR